MDDFEAGGRDAILDGLTRARGGAAAPRDTTVLVGALGRDRLRSLCADSPEVLALLEHMPEPIPLPMDVGAAMTLFKRLERAFDGLTADAMAGLALDDGAIRVGVGRVTSVGLAHPGLLAAVAAMEAGIPRAMSRALSAPEWLPTVDALFVAPLLEQPGPLGALLKRVNAQYPELLHNALAEQCALVLVDVLGPILEVAAAHGDAEAPTPGVRLDVITHLMQGGGRFQTLVLPALTSLAARLPAVGAHGSDAEWAAAVAAQAPEIDGAMIAMATHGKGSTYVGPPAEELAGSGAEGTVVGLTWMRRCPATPSARAAVRGLDRAGEAMAQVAALPVEVELGRVIQVRIVDGALVVRFVDPTLREWTLTCDPAPTGGPSATPVRRPYRPPNVTCRHEAGSAQWEVRVAGTPVSVRTVSDRPGPQLFRSGEYRDPSAALADVIRAMLVAPSIEPTAPHIPGV